MRRDLERIQPSEDGLQKTLRLVRRRERNRRLGAGALGLLLTAGLMAGIWSVRQPSQRQPGHRPGAGAASHIAFSRGGPNGGIYEMNPDGTGVTRVTFQEGDTDPAWSPDGSKVAFDRFQKGNEGIYVMNADGAQVVRLTSDNTGSDPAWSPDGTRIAFQLEAHGNADIYVMNADGSQVTRVTDDPLSEYTPAWSPDGTRIALVGYSEGASGPPSPVRLYVMNVDGTGLMQLGPDGVAQPNWSPDGTKIAFVNADSGSIDVINTDGTGLMQVVDLQGLTKGRGNLTMSPTWSPDGTKIAFASGTTATSTHVYIVNLDGSGLIQLTEGSVSDANPAWG
jgi:Tol biopolymer transport system component